MQTRGAMMQRPPRVMCWVPWSWARRETRLPVSVSTYSDGGVLVGLLEEVEDVVVVGGIWAGWRGGNGDA